MVYTVEKGNDAEYCAGIHCELQTIQRDLDGGIFDKFQRRIFVSVGIREKQMEWNEGIKSRRDWMPDKPKVSSKLGPKFI